MGFTPLEGLVMGARSGDVDAGAILHLISRITSADDIRCTLLKTLNSGSGLKGISESRMTCVMLNAVDAGDQRARLAVDTFCYRARKYIGLYLAAMGGADVLVFTWRDRRELIRDPRPNLRRSRQSGIALDPDANNAAGHEDRCIGESSGIPVWVVPTDEELLIARDTLRCVLGIPGD